jgi:hypothetical protein
MNWNFDKQLRTRDKMMWLLACVYMAKADASPEYLQQAKILARQVNALQYTDYKDPISGAYGTFYEFENSTEAMMLEWIQAFNLHLGNQTPTDLSSFLMLLEMYPDDPDAAMWLNTVTTYVNGYVKPTSGLTPLGIYPIAAYNNPAVRGVRFFQVISHGASSHYGMAARNLMPLAAYLEDAEVQRLAENNVQFMVGLNPGFPTDSAHTNWKSHSLLYLQGNRFFRGFFNGGAYRPPIGSGFNGFSAGLQFSVPPIASTPDYPLGIIDANGGWQFNEDYLPHGLGYASGVAAVESPVRIPVAVTYAGAPVKVGVTVTYGENSLTFESDNGHTLITGVPAGASLTIDITAAGRTLRRTVTAVAGTMRTITVDMTQPVSMALTVPAQIGAQASGTLTLMNEGDEPVSVRLSVFADGVDLSGFPESVTVTAGESRGLPFTLTPGGQIKPYMVYAYGQMDYGAVTVFAGGLTG